MTVLQAITQDAFWWGFAFGVGAASFAFLFADVMEEKT